MIELLEKLINEHGSSAILKERLGLVAAEYEALSAAHLICSSRPKRKNRNFISFARK